MSAAGRSTPPKGASPSATSPTKKATSTGSRRGSSKVAKGLAVAANGTSGSARGTKQPSVNGSTSAAGKGGTKTKTAARPASATTKRTASATTKRTATASGTSPTVPKLAGKSQALPKTTSGSGGRKTAVGPYAGDQKFLAEQRALLMTERTVYQGQAEDLRAEADSLAQEREPGDVQFDEESGEGGTVTVDRERDLALSAQAVAAVEEIDDALGRIGKATYGACERCHQPIPKPRLRALPFARLCVACKSGGLSRR